MEFYKIPNFNYEISLCGKVRKIGTNKYLKLDYNKMGYPRFRIMVNKKVYRLMIHRVLAEIFIPKSCPKQNIVNHKNFNKKDFSINNLEWVTQSENIKHYYNYR